MDGQLRAWMKHPNVQTIETYEHAKDSDKSWSIKGFEPWVYYQILICHVWNPNKLMECLQTNRWLAHQPLHQNFSMIRLLNVSMSRHHINYVINCCCRLPRRCTILATSLTMLAMMWIEILKSNDWFKVILHQSTSPPLYQPCVCKAPSPKILITQVSPAMEWRSQLEWRSQPVASDHSHKIQTTIDKGSKVRHSLIPSVMTLPALVSPALLKNLHIAASCTMAVCDRAKYDPLSAQNKQQEDEKRHLLLNLEYRIHQLS